MNDPEPARRERLRERAGWSQRFGLDLRSLALFRMILGAILMWDAVLRAVWARAFYSDAGVLPRSELYAAAEHPVRFLLAPHFVSGEWQIQLLLFALTALIGLLLMVGYRTRLMTVLGWIMVTSIWIRNPINANGGDTVFRMLFFWSMFLPLGRRFSLDRMMHRDHRRLTETLPESPVVCSLGTICLMAQVTLIYLSTAYLKTGFEWRVDGTAGWRSLKIEHMALPAAQWLLMLPRWVLEVGTRLTWWIELLVPLLLWVPIAVTRMRLFVVGVMIALHLQFVFTLAIGLFPWICLGMWLVFLPSGFWEFVSRERERGNWRLGGAKEISADSRAERWAVFARGAEDPYATGPRWARVAGLLFAGFSLFYVLAWNARVLDRRDVFGNGSFVGQYVAALGRLTEGWEAFGDFFRLHQSWGMFAPYPFDSVVWFVAVGNLEDGSQVDLFRHFFLEDGEAPVSWERPPVIRKAYPDSRGRKYMVNLRSNEHERARALFCDYLAREWARENPDKRQLQSVELCVLRERISAYFPNRSYPPVTICTVRPVGP